MQTLFEWDFEGRLRSRGSLEESLIRNADEFAPGTSDIPFMKGLLSGILEKRKDLDTIIEKAAPDWPIDKISPVDRNILRLGLYELLFADRSEVPAKVAINEAIELAKSFGGENSGKFVNGVLGAVYKELGEPGKNETSKNPKKKRIPDIPFDKMPIERLGGAVVYAKHDNDVYLALVHDIFGHWTLSKGHFEEGENDETAIKRVVKEELGLKVTIKEPLGKNEYVASDPEKGKIRKQVNYFLAEAPFAELHLPEGKGGLDDVKWFKLANILELNFYDDILPIVTRAINLLLQT